MPRQMPIWMLTLSGTLYFELIRVALLISFQLVISVKRRTNKTIDTVTCCTSTYILNQHTTFSFRKERGTRQRIVWIR